MIEADDTVIGKYLDNVSNAIAGEKMIPIDVFPRLPPDAFRPRPVQW